MNPLVIKMTGEMHSSNDTNLSIADVYNQVSVKCQLED
jgi:hypothetical protein